MRFAAALIVLALWSAPAAQADPFGPLPSEPAPAGAQAWRIPSVDPELAARALLYRPAGAGPFRLAVIAHASTENPLRRAQMPQPDYHALAGFLVRRGYAVLVPERLGHGRNGGPYREDQGGCDEADYVRSGRATADQISRAVTFMQSQPFIARQGAVVIGHSAGGWGALALAGEDPRLIAAIIAFAPGRGGHADDIAGRVCAPERLVAAARLFGQGARVPVTWLVAANDSYFTPDLSQRLADAFKAGGGKVSFTVLPATGDEGHWLAERDAAITNAAAMLARVLPPAVMPPR